MALKPGTQVGPYEITAPLGAGGMGEVYRATDTKLKREVAIKILPEDVAGDTGRLARFEREALVLASLNHPHVGSIYGLEESGGVPCLVLELVEGQTLAERLAAGALPVEKALDVARQIASALEAAHEKGIIHRDLKPANVKITPEGTVKVLDFGLAKAFAVESEEVSSDSSQSPTVTMSATRAGVILGTAAYMSPEQARGKPVDKRTDIWAFGCVLYEMLTGRRVFLGGTASDSIARILERSPQWDALPARTPLKVRELLKRCLAKDGRDRLHDIADARIEIEEVLADPAAQFTVSIEQPGPGKMLTRWLPWLVVAVALVTLAWNLLRDDPVQRPEPTRASLVLPAGLQIRVTDGHALALSPDGSRLVVAAHDEGGSRLYLRDLAGDTFVPLPGTEGAKYPFFSPDGEWVAFTDDDFTLKKTAVARGNPVVICDKAGPAGGSWGPDGSIIFPRGWSGGLWRVPAAGGQPAPLAPVDAPEEYRVHLWPQVLPGGSNVLYTHAAGTPDESKIMVVSLETGEHRVVADGAIYGRYATSGHLLYVRGATLFAQPFDSRRLESSGPPVPVLDDVGTSLDVALAHFTFAGNGTLVFLPQSLVNPPQQLVWVKRDGSARAVLGEPGTFHLPRVSPDGGRIALCSGEQSFDDVWIHDLVRENRTRLTVEAAIECGPIWTPDGQHVVYLRSNPDQFNLFRAPADGSRPGKLLYDSGLLDSVPTSISPDGMTLLFHTFGDQETEMDIWQIPLEGEQEPAPLVRTRFSEWGAAFSPDGGWIAFVSAETGTHEVYVQAFPDSRGKIRVSSDGGAGPVWSKDGAELFYRSGDRMMAVEVETAETFIAGKPRLLFEGRYKDYMWYRDYDVAPDGRFLMVKTPEEHAGREINVIFNWFEELERLAPTK